MSENISVLISEEKIKNRISEIAMQLNEKYKGEKVTVICTLKGAFIFAADLVRQLETDVRMEFLSASSYRGTESTGTLVMKQSIDQPITGENVIVVEDILDTGRTLKHLKEYFTKQEPKSLLLVTLLDKPDRRVADIQCDVVGFTIPDRFVVGYGLDYDQQYRNLPYIGVLDVQEVK